MAFKLIIIAGGFGAVLLLGFLLGPRPKTDTQLKPVALPPDIDAYLAEQEAKRGGIAPGVEKRILWAEKTGRKTAISIVYLHGFSATHREIAPVCELVAEKLQANVFFSRLTGHGHGSDAMLEASVNDWLNDANEALEIGQRIGERVLIVGTSNGGALATWLLANHERKDAILGAALISPNFGPSDKRSAILAWPWGVKLAEWIQGKEFRVEPKNELHRSYWTLSYPTAALAPMQAMVNLGRAVDKRQIETPLLVIYNKRDRVVDPGEIEKAFEAFGSKRKQLIAYEGASEDGHHLIAGDALSPQSNHEVASLIATFAEQAKQQGSPPLAE